MLLMYLFFVFYGLPFIRYCVLFDLPYFEPIDMVIIDSMHCLLLGIGRHYMKHIISAKYISEADLFNIQKFVDDIDSPTDVTKISTKIDSKFSGLTADQMKVWITS